MLDGILCCKMLLLSCLMMQDRGLVRGGTEGALATRNFRIQRRERDLLLLPPLIQNPNEASPGSKLCSKTLNDATELCIKLKDAL